MFQFVEEEVDVADGERRRDIQSGSDLPKIRYGFGHVVSCEPRANEGVNLEIPGFQSAYVSLRRIRNRERPDSSGILTIEPTEGALVH